MCLRVCLKETTFIHFQSPLVLHLGSLSAGSHRECQRQTDKHTHFHTQGPVLTGRIFLECGKKLKKLERTFAVVKREQEDREQAVAAAAAVRDL